MIKFRPKLVTKKDDQSTWTFCRIHKNQIVRWQDNYAYAYFAPVINKWGPFIRTGAKEYRKLLDFQIRTRDA